MHWRKFIVSIVILVILLVAGAIPLGPLPPLFALLNPQTGVWAPNPGVENIGPRNFTLSQNGSSASLQVVIDPNGFIRIASNETWALYYEQGYLTAKYRLTQLDFTRRLAEGNLSAILGSSELSSDESYRTLEMYPVAQEIVSNLSRTSLTYVAVSEFTMGVNSYISSLTPETTPLLFKLLQYSPAPWKMADTFVVQQLLTWQLSSSEDPLYFNNALTKMPENVLAAFYPVYPGSVQHPVEPESLNPSIYSGTGNLRNLSLYTPTVNTTLNLASDTLTSDAITVSSSEYLSSELTSLLGGIESLSLSLPTIADYGSNNWAVGSNLTGNGALLANDPHLSITVPPIWLGFQLVSPGQNVVGVTFPGAPGIVLGHNPFIAWGATDSEDQVTYYYSETVNPTNPGQYMHDGSWTNFSTLNETIPVKGGPAEPFQVKRAVNGVIIQGFNGTIALDWTGLYPSDELAVLLQLDLAKNVSQAQIALQGFKVGIQNWAVADSSGNIGIFTYGSLPVINEGNPRGILPGTGQYDWTGFIPLAQQPSLYDPSSGFVFSANQIQVSPSYPFYIGWSFESGYRADQIYSMLSSFASPLNTSDMAQVQLSVHDYSTNIFLPPLLKALSLSNFSSGPEYATLASWNGDMNANSSAATIYYTWLENYINDTFLPYMQYCGITPQEGLYSSTFFIGPDSSYHGPLVEDLANWTVNYPNIQWFNNPVTKQQRNSSVVMLEAFHETESQLESKLGAFSETGWAWGKIHARVDPSLLGVNALSGPTLPASGDDNAPNAAYGLNSSTGPSWRQIANTADPLSSVGIYPGGLSENPATPYYSNTVANWNDGLYYILIPDGLPTVFYYLYPGGTSSP